MFAGLLLAACQLPAPETNLLELPQINNGDVIIEHTGYVTSYNPKTRIPVWVAYELTDEETRGDEERTDRKFKMDPLYKGTQAMREDYSNSGWTKGHMAPAADFRWDSDAMDETFYLTNICPQCEELNTGDWEYLERQVRYWARDYGKVWVVTGPIVGDAVEGTIGERSVTVPDAFFKAVLVWTGFRYSAIAFVMGNDSQRYYLKDCAMSIDSLEDLTGLDFFPALDDETEELTEKDYTLSVWGI